MAKVLDDTMERIIEPSLTNLRRDRRRNDILDYIFPVPLFAERYIIAGAGASLDETLESNFIKDTDCVLTNQGSVGTLFACNRIPDIYVLVDPQPIAAEPLDFIKPFDTTVFAATTTAVDPLRKNTFFFKNLLHNPEEDKRKERYNSIVSFVDETISSYVLQVGSVTNASLLLLDYLITNQRLPKLPIVFVGVDGGEYKHKWRCRAYNFKEDSSLEEFSYPDPPISHLIEDEFGFSTYAHKEYLSQLEYIVKYLNLEVYTSTINRLSRFLPIYS
jgi:hypothetical protein